MKKIVVILALIVGAIVPVSAQAFFYSDTFQSPTGNLICKWRAHYASITCGSFASQKVVVLSPFGRPLQGNTIRWNPGRDKFYTLRYGDRYNVGQPVSCISLSSGMRCQNTEGWYFKIDRDRIFVGRYGQMYYVL